MRARLLTALTAAALVLPTAAASAGEALAPPPAGGVYHAANAGFGGTEDHVDRRRIRRFERLAGKPIAWAYFSNNWTGGVNFPARQVAAVEAAGRLPFIRLEPRSSFRPGGPDRRYTMQSILSGVWDAPRPGSRGLVEWCRRAAAYGGPLLAEFGTEVNGSWFPWNGRWNGAGATTGYGDPLLADGPERFRDAFRHIVDVCRLAGATNITWFFHVDVGGSPAAPWNEIANYYPGDSYVDWIGVSDYGSLSPDDRWRSFGRRYDRVRAEIVALPGDKPVAVLETGVLEDRARRGRKAGWTRRTMRAIRTRFPGDRRGLVVERALPRRWRRDRPADRLLALGATRLPPRCGSVRVRDRAALQAEMSAERPAIGVDGMTRWLGLRWERHDRVWMTIRDELINPAGLLSGPVAYAMVDYCMGSTLWQERSSGERIATISIAINYVQTAREGEIVCATTLDRRNDRIAVLSSRVEHDDGRLLATAIGSFAIFPRERLGGHDRGPEVPEGSGDRA